MNTLPSPRSTYAAAFLLGGLVALLLAAPARSAEPFRLDRIGIVRLTPTDDGQLSMQAGVLSVAAPIQWRGAQTLPRPATLPDWALNRDLVSVNAWLAYHSLGGAATANFELQAGGVHIPVGAQSYFAVGIAPFARSDTGRLVNISTRARLAGVGDFVIAGFVIEERPRAVLIRAVGPSLAQFGVSGHPDPWLSIKRNDGLPDIANDDWENQEHAALVRAAAVRVGAFPLATASFDAAKLVILPPGAYTVHVSTSRIDVGNAEVLVEVYGVPEDIFD